MKTEVKKIGKNKLEIKCELEWEEFQVFCLKALENLAKNVTLKGFRPGKAPKDLVEKQIARNHILEEAADLAIQGKYIQVLKEKQIEPISSPIADILKIADNNPFVFKIEVEVLPELKLPEYKKIAKATEKKIIEVKEKEIQDTLLWARKSRAVFNDLNQGAIKGNFVQVEYQSPRIENNKLFQDNFALGEGRFALGFEENLFGMKSGEEKEFSFSFPQDYFQKDLAGKQAGFKAKMLKVQEIVLPELNNDFAKQFGFENMEEAEKNIREGLKKEKEAAEKTRWQEAVLENIAKQAEIDIPESLVKSEQERMMNNLKHDVQEHLKISFEEYLQESKKTEQEIQETLAKSAEVESRNFLILREIGKQENIKIEDYEVEEEVAKFLASYPQADKTQIDIDKIKSYYRSRIFNDRVFEKLSGFSS